MSNHFIAINRGTDGFTGTDFTFATSSTTAADVELRIADVDAQSKALTRKDVIVALYAFLLVLESGNTYTTFPPL